MSAITQTASAPRLPTELTDIIVDFLHDDEESLANCSLVCKAWLPAARYHIFKELLLHPWNVGAFTNLITHSSATVVPHIHNLVIDQVKFRNWHIGLFDAMFLRWPLFDFVRRLELRNSRWYGYRARSFDGLVYAFQSVTDVRFDSLIFDRPSDLWSLVSRFPSLNRLSVTNLSFIAGIQLSHRLDVADILPHLRPPNIRDLELRELAYQQTHVLEWFSSRGTFVNSLSVSLGCFPLPSLNQYLQVLGPFLLFLQMDIQFYVAGACAFFI
jgi:hypothetical protein